MRENQADIEDKGNHKKTNENGQRTTELVLIPSISGRHFWPLLSIVRIHHPM